MPKPKGTHYVISAGETDTGAPVYLTASGRFSRNFKDSRPIEGRAELDALLADALRREREVCDPYTFMVEVRDGAIDPLSARERIRATGPTTIVRRPDR